MWGKEKRKLEHKTNTRRMERDTGRGRYQKWEGKIKNIGGVRDTSALGGGVR